jgi:hypothetical protein
VVASESFRRFAAENFLVGQMKAAGVNIFVPIDGGGVGMVVPGGAGRIDRL